MSFDIEPLKFLEQKMDHFWDSVALPHKIRSISIWHLLTVYEDMIRMAFLHGVRKKEYPLVHIDDIKYAIKFAFDKAYKEGNSARVSTPDMCIEDAFDKSFSLIDASNTYAKLHKVVSSLYSGRSSLSYDGEFFKLRPEEVDSRYVVLEYLGHGEEVVFDYICLALALFSGDDPLNLSKEIVSGCRLNKKRVVYKYNPILAYEIVKYVEQRKSLFPEDFIFQWGGYDETHSLINSLLIRCLYHVLSVGLYAQSNGNELLYAESLVLKIKKEQLLDDLASFSSVSEAGVEKFLKYLTYGYGVENSDFAVQSLILSGDCYLVSCFHILNSNVQRNMLALCAKIEKNNFDRQSYKFEQEMVRHIELKSAGFQVEFNKTYCACGRGEEVDGLYIDVDNKLILLCEMRWMIQPGDGREVVLKADSCYSKVFQVLRKIRFFRENLDEILSTYFDTCNSSGWAVEGVVIVDGFSGVYSSEVVVVTKSVFEFSLATFNNVLDIKSWLMSYNWLPNEGVHYEYADGKLELDGIVMKHKGLIIKSNSYEYNSYLLGLMKEQKEKASKGD